jgi:hypothetical protein
MSRTLATLGPAGSDSENAARVLAPQLPGPCAVVLLDSFAAALRYAIAHDGFALLPAAYQEKDAHGRTQVSWADTHFQVEADGELELWLARVLPLKELALAKRKGVNEPQTIALHAAVQYYASTFLPGAAPAYHTSKPAAVHACAEGRADACLGSLDVVLRYPELEVLRTFSARMCWTIYRKAQPLSARLHAAARAADSHRQARKEP